MKNEMTGYVENIEEKSIENTDFRKVLFTGRHLQLVVMCLKPNEEIGVEVHSDTDQFLRVEAGQGVVIINGEENVLRDGSAIVVPVGAEHNIINTSSTEHLKLYTIYAPPHHKDGVVHKTKNDAEVDHEDHL